MNILMHSYTYILKLITKIVVVTEVALGKDKGMEKKEKEEEQDINHRDTAHTESS